MDYCIPQFNRSKKQTPCVNCDSKPPDLMIGNRLIDYTYCEVCHIRDINGNLDYRLYLDFLKMEHLSDDEIRYCITRSKVIEQVYSEYQDNKQKSEEDKIKRK